MTNSFKFLTKKIFLMKIFYAWSGGGGGGILMLIISSKEAHIYILKQKERRSIAFCLVGTAIKL